MFHSGRKIGPYILDRALGEGSYGVVWLAEERTGLIQRQVALKLPKDVDPDIESIRREAETWLAAGKHQHVVQVLHADIYDGQVAIATEYIDGGSLHEWLQRQPGKVATLEQSVEMTDGILAGLDHLHRIPPKPLVHRDLKPGNVLLKGSTPMLTDFGLSRVFSSTTFTQSGGTPAYMPPEAFNDRFSPQTDIWAAGISLYRMIKGELPFPQRELASLIGAILNKEPEPLPFDVPYAIEAVIMKALMKDPDRRFGSAEEMRLALREALQSSATGPKLAISTTTRVLRSPREIAPWLYESPAAPSPPAVPPMPLRQYGQPPDSTLAGPSDATIPAVPPLVLAPAALERRAPSRSEALTDLPEMPRQKPGLSQRVDELVRRLGQNTTTFCGSLLASLPIWGGLATLEHYRAFNSVPAAMFLFAGLMSLTFARLAWHRYYWKPAEERRRIATRYAVLGLLSITAVPVIVVAFYVAISSATQSPSEAPPETPAETPIRETKPPLLK